MMSTSPLTTGKSYLLRLEHDGGLIEQITEFCKDKGIRLGRVEAIGAVKTARIGYYNQTTREYQFAQLDQPMEILKLAGNVSLKDGTPMVHAHITLADEEGKAWGGHLAPGTVVFACECLVQELNGDELNRAFDEQTGLPLWKN